MKANELIKKFGWGLAYDVSRCKSDEPLYCQVLDEELSLSDQEVLEIKRLVESHELVDVEGGIDQVKDTFSFAFKHGADELTEYGKRLKQAIFDVESCQ